MSDGVTAPTFSTDYAKATSVKESFGWQCRAHVSTVASAKVEGTRA